MKILSIETSGKVCAVALAENDKLIKEKKIEDENTHSVKLMPLVEELLKEEHISIQDIDLFACDIGPGSFTGIRIGVSTVKAFLDVTRKQAVGVTSLELLAYHLDTNAIICSLIDAKNKNVYAGFFKKKDAIYEPIGEFAFSSIEGIIQKAKDKKEKIIFIGNGSILYKDMIESNIENVEVITDEEKNELNARNIAHIAYLKQKEAVDSNHLQPIYLRKSNAER